MKARHLNCGTLHVFAGAALFGSQGLFKHAPAVTHCLLVETEDGLLLVDCGQGRADYLSPTPFIRMMNRIAGLRLDLSQTAHQQVTDLGYRPEHVRHIALTHFHYDHAGGLPDFPQARVHIFADEYQAVTRPMDLYEKLPYRREHWAHGPDWQVHQLDEKTWFGLSSTPAIKLGSLEMRFIPLKGHTRGHSAVALCLDDGWLLHCGDAYTFHGDVDTQAPFKPPNSWLWRPLVKLVRPFRLVGIHSSRLRQLLREHGDEVTLTCTHDPVELYKFTQ